MIELGSQVRRHPRVAHRAARQLDRIGARAAAERLDRAADVVTVRPPHGRPFGVHRIGGRDQIANAVGAGGWQGFERPLPDVFGGLARATTGLVVDIGANTGFYSLLALSLAAHIRVVAFEPYPPAAHILQENLRLNFVRRIELSALALGRQAGLASLHIPDPVHGLVETSASLNHRFRDEGTTTAIDVTVSTLDIEMHRRPGLVGLIKIDVESTEHDVVVGGEHVIARDRPVIVLEVLPVGDLDALERFRQDHSYVDIRLRPDDVIVGEPVRFDPDGWNHVWTPAERLDQVLTVVRASGLAVR
jgi:FkbM family methyltransferase